MATKLIYMGTPEYAKTILEGLLEDESFEVVLVLTQPDKPVGRKKVITPPPVKVLAQNSGVEVFQPVTLKDSAVVEKLKSINPDFIVVAAYGQILPREILDIAPCINLHASILPKYRGASPIQEAILNGDRFTGVTAMMMEEGLDSGDMLTFSFIEVGDLKLDELTKRLSDLAKELTLTTLKEFENLSPIPQTHALASYCKKIKKSDGKVTLNLPATEIYRRFRAFYNWPQITLDGRLKLLDIEVESDESLEQRVGEILAIEMESIIVATARGSIKIHTLQPQGKKAMSAKSYLAGRRLKVGDTLL